MLNNLNNEIFLHGNMELCFSLKEIKNIDLKELFQLEHTYNDSWCWRFYKNFKSILSTREFDIINKQESFILFLKLLDKTINDCIETNKIKLSLIDVKKPNYYLIVIYCLLKDIKFKIQSYKEHISVDNVEKIFSDFFSKFFPYFEEKNIILDYVSPFEGNSWTSSWKLIYDNKELKLNNIDIYTDTYFFNENIYYNNSMCENLVILEKRLLFLKQKASLYFEEVVKKNLTSLTTKIFNIFPLNLVYKHYRNLISVDENVFVPELYTICNKSDTSWFFSIFPIYLSGYILGFPIITSDVPSCKNIKKYVEDFDVLGIEKYFQNISLLNKKKIQITVFNIPCGNSVEEEEIFDLTLTKVINYNMDDIMIFFNVGVYHVFTPPEFPNLVKKEINPYNRKPIPVFNNILENMRFRKKVTRYLSNRGLKVKLLSTLQENYESLLEALNDGCENFYHEEDNNIGMDIFNSSFINFLINSYNV